MADDGQDFLEDAASVADKLHGHPVDGDKMVENFAICGPARRAKFLHNMDAELRGELNSSPRSLRRRVQLMDLRRKMGSVHEALRKARR